MRRLDLAEPTIAASPGGVAALDLKPLHAVQGKAGHSVIVLVPADRARAWSRLLAEVISARCGLPVELRRVPSLKSKPAIPSEDIEHALFGPSPHGHAVWMPIAAIKLADDIDDWSQHLVVNATGHDPRALPPAVRRAKIVSPIFNGRYDFKALAVALIAGEPPHLGVTASVRGTTRVLYGARLAASARPLLRKSMDAVLGRAIVLLSSSINHLITRQRLPTPTSAPSPEPAPPPLEFWARRLGFAGRSKVGQRLQKPFLREEWRIGLRPLRSDCSPAEMHLDPSEFDVLENPPGRYYADPFLLRHDDITAVFFEDFDFRLGRAHVSCIVLDQQGGRSPARTALKRPYHLSYPFVFNYDGAALMIPETSANRTIELYEAESFPYRWRLRKVLIDGIDASDTTLHFDERTGLWWMFSAVSEFGSSSHDSLSIFFSHRLEGPWRPHAGNPVKLDPASSRPAGPLLRRDGRLFRPTQDCTLSYGSGLVWCEIKRIDPYVFRESPITRPGRTLASVHTYGRASGFEVLDLKANRWRFRA